MLTIQFQHDMSDIQDKQITAKLSDSSFFLIKEKLNVSGNDGFCWAQFRPLRIILWENIFDMKSVFEVNRDCDLSNINIQPFTFNLIDLSYSWIIWNQNWSKTWQTGNVKYDENFVVYGQPNLLNWWIDFNKTVEASLFIE